MIDVLLYSVAGKKQNQVINDLLLSFAESDYIAPLDKKILKHTLEVGSNGSYPTVDYYSQFYNKPEFTYKSISEILSYAKKALDFYKVQFLNKRIVSAMNDSNTSQELLSKLESITTQETNIQDEDSLDSFNPILYSESCDKPFKEGIMCGVNEIDSVTNGFQSGCISCIAAFTSHGKSTFVNSALFKNALEGKKCVLLSLELSPKIVWPMIQARYLYQVKGVNISSQDLLFHKLTSENAKKVNDYDKDFREDICSNLLIVDESVLNKNNVNNFRQLSKLFRTFEQKLGGLDLVAIDHVGQLELLFPTLGNQILKQLQSVAKTYTNNKGENIVEIWAVQCNREGEKRARKRNGVYDMQAISDLNECASSHTPTCVHLNGKKLNFSQVAKYKCGTVECVDYSTGRVKTTEVSDAFSFKESLDNKFKWVKLSYVGSGKNIIFTPEHRVLVNGVKVKLKDLPENFKCDCVDWIFPKQSYQIVLGTLLGDSVISKSAGSSRGTYSLRLIQGVKQTDYLQWKKEMLGDFVGNVNLQGSKRSNVLCSKTFRPSLNLLACKSTPCGVKPLTLEVLKTIDWLGLCVWYLDDGCLVHDSPNSYHVVISCSNFGIDGAKLMQKVLRDKFNLKSALEVRGVPKKGTKQEIRIRLYASDSRTFLKNVSVYCTASSVQYKLLPSEKVEITDRPYRGVIKSGLDVHQEPYEFPEQSKTKLRCKYNFTVKDDNHNYLMPGGLVSANCERSASYVIFMYTSDDMKVVQETKLTLAKHRLGEVITEPIITTFNPSISTVGSTIEKIQMTDDDLGDLGSFDFSDDF